MEAINDNVKRLMQQRYPGAWAAIEHHGCTHVLITHGDVRTSIRFIGVPGKLHEDFSRHIDHEDALIIVDGTSELHLTTGRPVGSKAAKELNPGDVVGCDPAMIAVHVRPRLQLSNPPRREATATVLRREAYYRWLRLDDGQEFEFDFDEIRNWAPNGFWQLDQEAVAT